MLLLCPEKLCLVFFCWCLGSNTHFIPIKEAFLQILKPDDFVKKPKEDYSFWTRYKRFASTEILLYVIMVIGIIAGILIFS